MFLCVVTTITSSLFASFLLYFLISWISNSSLINKRNKLKTPPEPDGSWPVVGHLLHLLSTSDLAHVFLGAIADKLGPIFTIRMGLHKAVVVSGWEVAKEVFTTHDKILISRPHKIAFKLLGYNYAFLAFSPYGQYWQEVRKISIQELLSNSRIEFLKHVWNSEINTSLEELHQVWLRRTNPQRAVLVDMKKWFSGLTFNIIVRMVAGKRYFATTHVFDDERHQAERCQKMVRNFFRLAGSFIISDWIPFLRWFDLGGHEKEMNKTARDWDALLEGWLDEHKMKRSKGKLKEEDKDFMHVMMDEKPLYANEYDADTVTKATCLAMILGGSDTMAVTLVWALCLLLNNRQALRKAHNELDIHIGKERQVDESDIKNLTYLQAILKETMRLYPAAPLGGMREAIEDCILAGYHVPAGTRLIVNIWKIQRDPMVWSDPLDFKPERFLTTTVGMDLKGQNYKLIPFNYGRRACPAISLALQVMHLTLARLVHGFEFETESSENVDMTESDGMTNAKATPLDVKLTPRLPSQLYVVN